MSQMNPWVEIDPRYPLSHVRVLGPDECPEND